MTPQQVEQFFSASKSNPGIMFSLLLKEISAWSSSRRRRAARLSAAIGGGAAWNTAEGSGSFPCEACTLINPSLVALAYFFYFLVQLSCFFDF